MRYSKGIMWLDDCRIPTNWKEERPPSWFNSGKSQSGNPTYDGNLKTLTGSTCGERLSDKGRFTPNLLVCDDMLNDGSVVKSGYNPKANIKQYSGGNFGGGKTNDNGIDYGDKGTNSRYYDLDKWFDKIIDEIR